jgi:hypothetical protein
MKVIENLNVFAWLVHVLKVNIRSFKTGNRSFWVVMINQSNSSPFFLSPRIFQVAYLNRDIFFTSASSFRENLSGFFPWDLAVVKISPEWVTGPEQSKSSCRIATFVFGPACLKFTGILNNVFRSQNPFRKQE